MTEKTPYYRSTKYLYLYLSIYIYILSQPPQSQAIKIFSVDQKFRGKIRRRHARLVTYIRIYTNLGRQDSLFRCTEVIEQLQVLPVTDSH